MGVLGDSISAATLADVPPPHCQARDEVTPASEDDVLQWSTAGNGSRLIYTNKRRLSWASGVAIESHYRLLRRFMHDSGDSGRLEVANMAEPGGDVRDLASQARGLVRKFKNGGYDSLKYVVMTVGSNDACDSRFKPDLPAIRQALIAAVDEIGRGVQQAEPIRLLVVGAPRIPELGAQQIQRQKTIFGLSCETVRNRILKSCNSLTQWSGESEFRARMEVVSRVNEAVASAATESQARNPNVRIHFSDRLFRESVRFEFLAADCFHPSAQGQERISLSTWQDQPWFPDVFEWGPMEELELRQVTPPSLLNPGTDDPAEWIA